MEIDARRDKITIEPAGRAVNVTFNGAVLASTQEALRLKEEGHEPVYYIPRHRVEMAFLHPSEKRTTCPLKGGAAENAVWSYEEPYDGVSEIAGHIAFDKRYVTIDDGIGGQDIVPGRDVA